MSAREGEVEGEVTLDAVLRGRLRLWQPARGARVTMDPLLLVAFVARVGGGGGGGAGRPRRVLDVGCGTGVIGLALAQADARARVAALELVPAMAALARRNVSENRLGERVEIVEADARVLRRLPWPPESFELIVSNPPYMPAGRGRVSPRGDRAAARAETELTLADVVEVARRFLSPRGRLALILPAERLAEACVSLAAAGLGARVVRAVHSVADEPARRVLLAAARGAGEVTVEPPLVVHGEDRKSYTAEAAAMLGVE